MKRPRVIRTGTRSRFWIAASALLASIVFFHGDAEAHGRHGHGRHRGHHHHDSSLGYRHGSDVGVFVLPRVLEPDIAIRYREYRAGEVFHARHRHRHVTYSFPVWIDGNVARRTYAYCNGRLFVGRGFVLPRLAVDLPVPPPMPLPPVPLPPRPDDLSGRDDR